MDENDHELRTTDHPGCHQQFLDGTQSVAFNVATDKPERYRWVQKTLVKHRYLLLGKQTGEPSLAT